MPWRNTTNPYKIWISEIILLYTHGQPAQASTLAHFLSAVIEFSLRDIDRLTKSLDLVNMCPMGAAAITTSGTASLECAVLDTPQIVSYKLSKLSGVLAKHFNKAPYISMANLIADKKIVPELVQGEVTRKHIIKTLQPLLKASSERSNMLEGYNNVRRTLGLPGAYKRAAEAIIKRTVHAKS